MLATSYLHSPINSYRLFIGTGSDAAIVRAIADARPAALLRVWRDGKGVHHAEYRLERYVHRVEGKERVVDAVDTFITYPVASEVQIVLHRWKRGGARSELVAVICDPD
jgi:hypothetical protein